MADQKEKRHAEIVEAESHHRFNTARFFVDNPSISAALLVTFLIWGVVAYLFMPKSKDPDIPVRIAIATTHWPGQSAVRVEELVTRKVEEAIAQSEYLHEPDSRTFGIKSLTLNGVSMVQAQLAPKTDATKAFNDLNLKLIDAQQQLPSGASKISLNSEFGDTAAVLLSVASPRAGPTEITLRAEDIREGISEIRGQESNSDKRVSIVVALPLSLANTYSATGLWIFASWLEAQGYGTDFEVLNGAGYLGVDFLSDKSNGELLAATKRYLSDKLSAQRFFPDAWDPFVVRNLVNTRDHLMKVAGAKYSYRQLDDFSDLIASNIRAIPEVKRVVRTGVLTQEVKLFYSQERLASYGLRPDMIAPVLNARNTTIPGGSIIADDLGIAIMPSGEFTNHEEIADVPVTLSDTGTPVYLRGIVDVIMGYQSPPTFKLLCK
ncbi:efflux RND transporter permease subunit [Microbulbifer sp. VAAF005]|uniref:efflux RND transporter permease subunit n=1 Tax=Microbulbifer sp. VAAF005 TaxID=3034230 RepID=UPI0024AD0295|nr:efflux RND transporter permease subunit [Microbulbifer sp. VAAF005]WHI46763.1 efflux RND transporter permease subunit [Microbulbifer sp. VAAF005]